MFKIYSAPSGAANISPMEKEHLLFKEALSMDEAISWASHMSKTGHSVVLIEGDDGTRLGASEIASALRRHTG
jgi:translation initiation factor 1 (eIF-1/SUI1)